MADGPIMKINIIGASGSGTTTLAGALSSHLGFKHLDADQYFWEKTLHPFEIKKAPEIRNHLLKVDMENHNDFILSGPVYTWESQFTRFFDLVIFLYVPPAIRMQRLLKREIERYGKLIETDERMRKKHKEFMEWAASYEDPLFYSSRTLYRQTEWINSLAVPVLKIEGDLERGQSFKLALEKIESL